jgi:hypothetical protein
VTGNLAMNLSVTISDITVAHLLKFSFLYEQLTENSPANAGCVAAIDIVAAKMYGLTLILTKVPFLIILWAKQLQTRRALSALYAAKK